MTLVSTLCGSNNVVMFADNEESISDLGKKIVDKLTVWDAPNHPFRFAIASATDDAMYVEMLERKLAAALLAMDAFSLVTIENELASTLTEFYAHHSPTSLIEILVTVQPLPSGRPCVFHMSHTAISIPSLSESFKNIGKGAYLADFILPKLLGAYESNLMLVLAAIYCGKLVHENTPGVGPVERIILLGDSGEYEELGGVEIKEFEGNMALFGDVISEAFAVAAIGHEPETRQALLDYMTEELDAMKARNTELWERIQPQIKKRAERRAKMQERKRKASGS